MGDEGTLAGRMPRWLVHLAMVLVFAGSCVVGRSVHEAGSQVALVWPATGVAVLWLTVPTRWRPRLLVLVAAGAVAALTCVAFGLGPRVTVASTLSTLVTPAVALRVTERLQGGTRLQLRGLRDLWALGLGALAGAAVGALLGPALVAVGLPDPAVAGAWMVRSFVSILLLGALGLRVRQRQVRTSGTAGPVEQVAVWAGGVGAAAAVFVVLDGLQVAFLVLPLAVWAALRLPTRAAAAHLAVSSATVIGGTLHGRGPFSEFPLQGGVALAHLYVAVLTVVMLAISLHRDELAELASRLDGALAEAEGERALLQAVHEAVNDGIIVYAADGSGLLRNPAATALIGPNPRRDEPRSWEHTYTFTRVDGTELVGADLPVVRALAGHDVVGQDILVRSAHRPQGRILSCDAHPLPHVAGAAWSGGAVAVFHDVTAERREAAEAARTRDLLAGVLDGATEQGVFATGPDHAITVFSSGAERLTGWSSAEVLGHTPGRFLQLAEVFARATELGLPPGPHVVLHGLADHGHTIRRWTLVRRDGSTFTAEMTLTQLLDEDGDAVGSVAVFTDVTAAIAAEQRLADSEEQFRLAFETAPTGMAVVDLAPGEEGRVLRVNDAFAAFIGRSSEELVTLRTSDLVHPDDVDAHLTRMSRYAGGERPVRGGVEQRFAVADGVRWARTAASLITPRDGRAPHLLVVVEDVTERHAVTEQLRRAALHDPLTGLPNRALLGDRLQHALTADEREQAGVTVLFIDLDGFKAVNDVHGHAAGDVLLRTVAERLVAVVRPGDTVARLGGDEFAVVCPRLAETEVAALTTRLDDAVALPVPLPDGAVVAVTASTGAASSVGGDDAERLLDEADQRMYATKRRQRGPVADRSVAGAHR